MKNFICSNVVLHFLKSNLDFTTKRKKKNFKSRNFDDFFYFEVQYLQRRLSDFDDLFCELLTVLLHFQIKRKSFEKISKFRNKFENVIFNQKNHQTRNATKTGPPRIKK